MTTYTAAAAIAAYQSGTTGTFDIVDTEADVASNLTGLETIASATSSNSLTLTLTDPADPITIPYSVFWNDRFVFRASGTYSLIVTGVTASEANLVLSSHVTSAQFADSAANIVASLGNLESLTLFGESYTITLTDSGPVTFNLSGSQWSGQKAVFGNIQSSFTVTIAGTDAYSAAAAVSDSYVTSVSVSDTANGVRNELDALATLASQGKLTSITLTDGGTNALTVTATQMSTDAAALADLTGTYSLAVTGTSIANAASVAGQSHVSSVAISDTGANIGANLDTLETLVRTDPISGITISDYMPIKVTPTQLTADADALGKISFYVLDLATTAANASTAAYQTHVGAVDVVDSAANVSANIDALQTLQSALKLDSISLTDSGTPTLTISDAQYSRDMIALAYISGHHNIALTGVNESSAATRLLYPNVISVAVVDSALDIPYALDSLQSMLNAGKLTGISLSDSGTPQFTITAAQLTNDAGALNLISTAYKMTVSGVTVANAATIAATSHVSAITIADTASDISTGLDTLQSMVAAGKVTGISVTDNGLLTLNQTQSAADSQAIAELTGNYWLSLQGVSAASATSSASLSHVRSVSVLDSAANVAAHLDSLEALAASSELTSITLTDSGTPTLTISESQFNNDALALQKISSSYKVATNSVSVAQFHTLNATGQVTAASISDSAANVAAGLDELQAGVAAGEITSIAVTDAGTPNLAISYTQMTADAQALHDIVGSYTLTINDVSIANLSSVAASSGVISTGVSDTAANIDSDLDALQSLLTAGKLTSLAITDGGTLSVTAAQMVSDAQVINDIAGNYVLTVTDASLASLTSSVVSHASEISVSDSSTNIAGNIDKLETYAASGKLAGVAVTDTAFNPISITAAQFSTDSAALKDLSGNFTLTINTGSSTNLTLTGLAGHANTVSFTDAASDYAISVSSTGDTVTVTDTGTGRTSTDSLSGITALQFGSQTDIVAETPGHGQVTTGNVTELYGAVFGRLPDVAGLKFYEDVLAQQPDLSLPQFAQWFLASPEYTGNSAHAYAQNSDGDAAFITDAYNNLLGRAPEAGAIPYYENVINGFTQGLTAGTAAYAAAQTLGHAYVLSYFSASAEFLGDVTITAANPSSTQHWLLLTNG